VPAVRALLLSSSAVPAHRPTPEVAQVWAAARLIVVAASGLHRCIQPHTLGLNCGQVRCALDVIAV
jgi:hypothetical protein